MIIMSKIPQKVIGLNFCLETVNPMYVDNSIRKGKFKLPTPPMRERSIFTNDKHTKAIDKIIKRMLVEDNFCVGVLRANMIFLRLELKMNEIIKLKKIKTNIASFMCSIFTHIYL
jgi:hypothetical protein